MSTTTSTRPAQPKATVKELQEALDKACAEYEDLVELHDQHMETYYVAHEGVHGTIDEIRSLERDRRQMNPIETDWTRTENIWDLEVMRSEHGQDMEDARMMVKEVRTQLREVTERITVLERQLAAKK